LSSVRIKIKLKMTDTEQSQVISKQDSGVDDTLNQ
jgi:hypothetical protein